QHWIRASESDCQMVRPEALRQARCPGSVASKRPRKICRRTLHDCRSPRRRNVQVSIDEPLSLPQRRPSGPALFVCTKLTTLCRKPLCTLLPLSSCCQTLLTTWGCVTLYAKQPTDF